MHPNIQNSNDIMTKNFGIDDTLIFNGRDENGIANQVDYDQKVVRKCSHKRSVRFIEETAPPR